jgi:hypothetical protein
VTDQIAKLATGAESESIKLRALRLILAEVIPVSRFPDFKRRIAAIRQELQERTDPVSLSCPAASCHP